MNVIKGTTPTIEYTFNTVQVSNIVVAILTFKKGDCVVVTKHLEDATAGEKTLSWTLTQEESLSLEGDARAMLNWRLADGTRGATPETLLTFTKNHVNEVI